MPLQVSRVCGSQIWLQSTEQTKLLQMHTGTCKCYVAVVAYIAVDAGVFAKAQHNICGRGRG